ncbi:conserved hypothetical membrane protein [Formosa agariphila KMM 3901]|uniref:Conserved hypothetical membrane protein n=1 Tax=Formosa agariphila (strain DSM 15362 / KCTC 12365 / LMG 23005 / KMM 3901 / M-2Alg 35-1) TaxID=1347342 RepID=T2KJS4_FORAG|nr:membrane protein [Formosa agariphila]CDF78244.1 conserved hypothetical membrane protein [Formosa agariphila KMM 3901]
MEILEKLFKFYLNASIHVALSVFSLAWITLLKFDLAFDESVMYFIFFASITGYNFVKYFGLAKFHRRALASWLRAIQLFSVFCFLFMCYFVLKLEFNTILYLCGFGIVTFMYAIPFLPKRFFVDKHHNLRSVSGLKVYLIGLVWAGVTVLLPLLNQHYQFNTDVFLTCFQRFIFIIALMLPFELRDLKYDSLKLGTIPQKIGVNNTKKLGGLLALVFFFLEYFRTELDGRFIVIQLIVAVMLILAIYFSKHSRSDVYTSFWVEGIPIVWLGLELFLTL